MPHTESSKPILAALFVAVLAAVAFAVDFLAAVFFVPVLAVFLVFVEGLEAVLRVVAISTVLRQRSRT